MQHTWKLIAKDRSQCIKCKIYRVRKFSNNPKPHYYFDFLDLGNNTMPLRVNKTPDCIVISTQTHMNF